MDRPQIVGLWWSSTNCSWYPPSIHGLNPCVAFSQYISMDLTALNPCVAFSHNTARVQSFTKARHKSRKLFTILTYWSQCNLHSSKILGDICSPHIIQRTYWPYHYSKSHTRMVVYFIFSSNLTPECGVDAEVDATRASWHPWERNRETKALCRHHYRL